MRRASQPTKLGLRPGDSVAVQDLILGIVTRSANDAAAVLAEGIAGSEPAFAELMNRKAQQLGMRSTVYQNASGLPDPAQHTTARDTAQLALALYHDFPREYRYFSTREFYFRGTMIVGHDHLLDWYPGADGIKTGFIDASGFNLATSAVRDGHRLVGVVLGGHSGGSRDREMAALLDQGFAEIGVAAPMTVARREPPRATGAPVAAAAAGVGQRCPCGRRGFALAGAGQAGAAAQGRGAARCTPLAGRQGRSSGAAAPAAARAAAPGAGCRSLGHPARRVSRSDRGREGRSRRRGPARRQGQADADRRSRQDG